VFILALLEFQNVSYINENKTLLRKLSLKVETGDFISIVGPSGSGKSTFLKLCCHLISPSEGKILFESKDVMQYNPMDLRKMIGYCAQTPYLFGDTVKDNLSFP
jgi:putative ABC transport system ATP-binding protein